MVVAPYRPRNRNTKIGIGSEGARWLPTSCRCINRFRSRHGEGEGGGWEKRSLSLSLSGGVKGDGSGERGEERPARAPVHQAGEQSSSNHEPLSGFSCVSLLPPRACGGVVCTCACAARPASRTRGFSALPRTLSAFALVGHGTRRPGTTRFRPTVLSGPRWMDLLRPFRPL